MHDKTWSTKLSQAFKMLVEAFDLYSRHSSDMPPKVEE